MVKLARSTLLLMPWVISCAAATPHSLTKRSLEEDNPREPVVLEPKEYTPKDYNCPTIDFSPIANTPGAVMLDPLSGIDDTTQLLDLGFDFYWLGGLSSTSQVIVSSNGQINMNTDDTNNNCCGPDPIGSYDKPRIAIAQEDLDPGDYGDVWVKENGSDSMIVSFEDVAFFSFTGSVYAQATLYGNGGVTICYGDGELERRELKKTKKDKVKKMIGKKKISKIGNITDIEEPNYYDYKYYDYTYDYKYYDYTYDYKYYDYTYDYKYYDYTYDYKYYDYTYYPPPSQTFAAGIEGGENDNLFPFGPPVAYPLPGEFFDASGIADTWPTDRCYCFDPVTHVWEDPSAPSSMPSSFPTETPSVSPTDSPTASPTNSPTNTCIDPAWDLSISGSTISCELAVDFPCNCDYPEFASYCKLTCGGCAEYECVDSTLTFLTPSGTEATCAMLAFLDPADLELYCSLSADLSSVCPATCGVCPSPTYLLDFEENVGSLDLFLSDPVSGLTFDNVYGMNPITEGYTNGYLYGTIGSFSVFNGFGYPGTIECAGGSFSLFQLYITPAWQSGISCSFTGTKSNGTTVSKTLTLGSTTSAILYDDWTDFTDLVSIYYSVIGTTHIVFDNMTVEISSPCIGGTTIGIPPVNDGSPPDAPRE